MLEKIPEPNVYYRRRKIRKEKKKNEEKYEKEEEEEKEVMEEEEVYIKHLQMTLSENWILTFRSVFFPIGDE